MKSFRRWNRSRRNIDRDGNVYNIARHEAHRDGIKITDKAGLNGYRLFEDITGQYCVQLMSFDEMNSMWSEFDVAWFDTMAEARQSAREQMKRFC